MSNKFKDYLENLPNLINTPLDKSIARNMMKVMEQLT